MMKLIILHRGTLENIPDEYNGIYNYIDQFIIFNTTEDATMFMLANPTVVKDYWETVYTVSWGRMYFNRNDIDSNVIYVRGDDENPLTMYTNTIENARIIKNMRNKKKARNSMRWLF